MLLLRSGGSSHALLSLQSLHHYARIHTTARLLTPMFG